MHNTKSDHTLSSGSNILDRAMDTGFPAYNTNNKILSLGMTRQQKVQIMMLAVVDCPRQHVMCPSPLGC